MARPIIILLTIMVLLLTACDSSSGEDFVAPEQPQFEIVSAQGSAGGSITSSCWPEGFDNVRCELFFPGPDTFTAGAGEALEITQTVGEAPTEIQVRVLDQSESVVQEQTFTVVPFQLQLPADLSDGDYQLEIIAFYAEIAQSQAVVNSVVGLNVGPVAIASDPGTDNPDGVDGTDTTTDGGTDDASTTDVEATVTATATMATDTVAGTDDGTVVPTEDTGTSGISTVEPTTDTGGVDTASATEQATETVSEETPVDADSATIEATATDAEITTTDDETPAATVTDAPQIEPTLTSTVTDAPTDTVEPTETDVPAPTSTVEATATIDAVAAEETDGQTGVLQVTPTGSADVLPTATSTSTATSTPTATSTNTPSPTATATATFTPTVTSTPTATFTSSNTPTPTPTSTSTPTDGPTATITPFGFIASATSTSTITPTPLPTLDEDEAPALILRVQGESFSPLGGVFCTDPEDEDSCEGFVSTDAAINASAEIPVNARVSLDLQIDPARTPAETTIEMVSRSTFLTSLDLLEDGQTTTAFDVTVPSGTYILNVEITWPDRVASYVFEVEVTLR